MLDEKMPGNLIQEIKASEHTASERIEQAQKDATERLIRIRSSYEKKFADLEMRFKQDKKDTIENAAKDACEQQNLRKEETDKGICLLEQRVKERRERALGSVMQRIMGQTVTLLNK